MPNIGEILNSNEIGKRGSAKYIWHACEHCGKQRWVQLYRGLPRVKLCKRCAARLSKTKRGEGCYNWKGGRFQRSDGYILAWLPSGDFFLPMAIPGRVYVLEHRLVMARHLNRCLLSWEVVHHKNGIRDDNRIENLELVGILGKHNTRLHMELKRQAKLISKLEAMIAVQMGRITLLEADLIQQSHCIRPEVIR